MVKRIDPKEFDLPARTIIEEEGQGKLTIVIDRRSRLIMADGRKIAAKAEKIKALRPGATLCVRSTAPVCSKTKLFLEENGIKVR